MLSKTRKRILYKCYKFHSIAEYESSIELSKENSTLFWSQQAENIHWFQKYESVLNDSSAPFYKWYHKGKSNMCYNALDRHVINGFGSQLALIYDSPVANQVKKITYSELLDEVKVFAGALQSLGLSKGDVVMIYMPMNYKAVVAMLACTRLGLVHCVTFGGFASAQLSVRIDHSKPKVLITASNGYAGMNRPIKYEDLIKDALELSSHKIDHVILLQREYKCQLRPKYLDWEVLCDGISQSKSALPECTSVDANDPLYILYTSGTTGDPKGIVRDLGYMVSLQFSMSKIFGCNPGEVFFAASDIGWVVGHSYIVYGPLLNRNTTVLYEGKPVGTPDPGAYFRICSEYNVNTLFTAPTALRMIKKEDPGAEIIKKYNFSNLKSLFLAGERSDPTTLHWAHETLKINVVDNYWQTESGWPMASNFVNERGTLFPHKYGSATKPVPGFDFACLDDEGNKISAGKLGHLVVKLPLPPGCFPDLYKNSKKFVSSYMKKYPGYYETGDSGMIDEDGYIFVMTRTDDIINVNGVRISTGAIEEVLLNNSNVAECAVVGINDEMSGEKPIALIVVSDTVAGVIDEAKLAQELIAAVRENIGKFTHLEISRVDHLPKTRSGKVLRNVIRNIGNHQPANPPATIEDLSVLTDIEKIIKKMLNRE